MGVKDELSKRTRSGVTSRTEKANRFNEARFVQFELSKEQSEACKNWTPEPAEVWDMIEREIDNGYKFTIKWDTYSDCYATFMQSTTDGHQNSGFILTGRGSSAGKAVKQILFKHTACLHGEWSAYVERRAGLELDD